MQNRNMMRTFSLLVLLVLALPVVRGQETDTINMVLKQKRGLYEQKGNPYRFNLKQIAIPAVLVGVGIIGLESDWLKYQNHEIRNELQENIDRKLTVDDFSQYAPMVAVYGLNMCGVKGKHDFVDRTVILATAYTLMGVTVNGLKTLTRVERPDGSSRNSFPSGHTATAFMGAEFLEEGVSGCFALDRGGGICLSCGHRLFPPVQQPALADGCTGRCGHRHLERESRLLAISGYLKDFSA